MSKKTQILILGSGFGGLYTALHLEKSLAKDADIEITLVNSENFFLFTPMLHEVAASDLDITHIVSPVRKLLKRIRFFEGDVESIDLKKNESAFRMEKLIIITNSFMTNWFCRSVRSRIFTVIRVWKKTLFR